jgi:hypothetical protein
MTPCLERPTFTEGHLTLLAEWVEGRAPVRQARARLERVRERCRQAPTRARRGAVVHAQRVWEQAVQVEAGRLYDHLWPGSAQPPSV